MQTRVHNQGNQNEGYWFETFLVLTEGRKAIDLTSLRVNCREINQVTPKLQMDFFDKTWKNRSESKQVNITIEYYIFDIV